MTEAPRPISLLIAACLCGFLAACGNDSAKPSGGKPSATSSRAPAPGSRPVIAANARFSYPVGIAADASGNLYVADTGNYTVRMISTDGVVTTIAGAAGEKGNVDGAGGAARFDHPTGVSADTDGNIYVIDSNAIRKIAPDGSVSTLAGMVAETGYADRKGAAALFYRPEGIAADSAGNLYVADTGNRAIRRISPAGEVSTLTKIDQEAIHSIAVKGSRLYVGGENCMWRVDLSGNGGMVLARMGGEIGVYDHVDGSTGIRFWPLTGITADQAGNVYATESFIYPKRQPPLGVIRKMTPSADGLRFTASTLAGNPAKAGSADGIGSAARFNLPLGIAADASGNLYVTDSYNHAVRKVTPAGAVTAYSGERDW